MEFQSSPCSSSSQLHPSGGPRACNLQEKAQMARDRMMAIAENAAKRRAVRERDQKVTSVRKMADEKATNAALVSDSQPEEMPVNETLDQ